MTAITNKKIDTGSLIKWLIILIVFAAIMFVPETETFTFAMKCFFPQQQFAFWSWHLN